MSLNIALVSLGCSKNLVDSEVMINLLSHNNFNMTNDTNNADIIIVNTCGFIESAKQESIDSIIELGELKNSGKCKVLIATGCLSERYKKQLMDEMPELDAVVGTGDYKDIVDIVNDTLIGKKIIKFGNQETIDINKLPRVISTIGATAYLKIAEGCDNRCTYCIIPKLRGGFRSRDFEDIVDEAKELASNGIKELNIIAQDTTKYGIDLYGKYRIAELLNRISEIQEIKWIRLLYSYPDDFSEELIRTIQNNDKICKYLDIPIQHASNSILKMMNRKTTKEQIVKLITMLKQTIPEIAIRTSLIVGFPGETEKDFDELVDLVKEVKFDRLGVFTYSKEEDTPAYLLPNQIEEDEKSRRQEVIMNKQMDISMNINKKMIGETISVLVEGYENDKYYGRSYKDAPEIDGRVYIDTTLELIAGDFYNVKIIEAFEYDLMGEIINEYSQ